MIRPAQQREAEVRLMQLTLPGAAQARKLYAQLAGRGLGRDGTQALFRLYGEMA